MAKLVEKKSAETVYTLELTEAELVTLFAAMGVTTNAERTSARIYKGTGYTPGTAASEHALYEFLSSVIPQGGCR